MYDYVGELVCTVKLDLEEYFRVIIKYTTERYEQRQKNTYMFRSSNICIINKTDLLPYLDFDVSKARGYALQINPDLEFIELSVKSGEGMELWYDWLRKKV